MSAADRPGRLARYILARGWAHALLLSFAGIFLFPFVWMVAASLKTDEELSEQRTLPSIPRFRAVSPYVRPAEAPQRPAYVPVDLWQQVLPQVLAEAQKAVAAVPPLPAADRIDPAIHRQAAAHRLADWALGRLPQDLWKQPPAEIIATFRQQLAADEASQAMDDSLGRLELRQLQVRTLEGHIRAIDDGGPWEIDSGPATLVPANDGVIVAYDFGQGQGPVVLHRSFTFPVPPADLHKLILSIKGDNSWHRVDATLDIGDTRLAGQRTYWIAQHRPAAIIFQPPSYEDQTYKPKLWIPLAKVGGPDLGRQTAAATLRLTIRPSSTAQAIYGKILRNYQRAFYAVPFWTYIVNSILLVLLTVGGATFSASFVAYSFARLNWPGRSVAFVILLATMMLPAQVTMIPSFMIWRQVGWYNTLNPMWVPAWFGGAFFIFLMTQHMRTIPRELEEAARIDGLSILQTWYYVILPQVKPTLAAIAIMAFMGAWNEFMGPLIYLRDQGRFPLSLGLFTMRTDPGVSLDWAMLMAGNVLMTLPVIVIFFAFQRYFIQGMTMSGMKA